MTVLKVLLVIALILFLLGLIRVGGEAEYSAEGFWAKIRVGKLKFQVFPFPPKKKKETDGEKGSKTPKMKVKTPENEVKTEAKKGGAIDLVKTALPLVGEAVQGLKRRIRIDRLELSYTAGGANDAAGAAIAFGYANAAIGVLFPFFEENFELKDYHFRTDLDFNAKSPVIYLHIAFSGRIGSLLFFVVRLALKFLTTYLRQRKEVKSSEKLTKEHKNRDKTQKEAT